MNADIESSQWLIGSPTGVYTRVEYTDPTGTHPLTPDSIRARYKSEIRNSALVVWRTPNSGIAGARAGVDETAWHEAEVAFFETSVCRPGKGPGYVRFAAACHSGRRIGILSSDRYDKTIFDWYLATAKIFERLYPGLTRVSDEGCDA